MNLIAPHAFDAILMDSEWLQLAAVLVECAPTIAAQEAGMRQLYDISLEGLVHLAAAMSSLVSAALEQGTPADAPALTPLVRTSTCCVSHRHVLGARWSHMLTCLQAETQQALEDAVQSWTTQHDTAAVSLQSPQSPTSVLHVHAHEQASP